MYWLNRAIKLLIIIEVMMCLFITILLMLAKVVVSVFT